LNVSTIQMLLTTSSSILVFELNKKFLIYKILSQEFHDLLRDEIIKNYGVSYVYEKNQEETSKSTKNNESPDSLVSDSSKVSPVDDENSENFKNKLTLTNDLIYEYFSTIINSYEISQEINYSYEYILLDQNQYIARFYLYKNLLVLCIQNLNKLEIADNKSELVKAIYSEFYASWCSKSLISLFKYKLGICSDEKSFTLSNQNDIKTLYVNWLNYFFTDTLYYLEAIEQLEVNEDIRMKCHQFLDTYVEFILKTEIIMSELDYIDEEYDDENDGPEGVEEDDEEYIEDNFVFPKSKLTRSKKANSQMNELEDFCKDLGQINQFILVYGNKLLYKYKSNKNSSSTNLTNTEKQTNSNSSNNCFTIDSSSIFLLLLEAAQFLEYKGSISNEEQTFNSASTTPSATSINDSESVNNKTEDLAYFTTISSQASSKRATILSNSVFAESFKSVKSSPVLTGGRLSRSSLKVSNNSIEAELNNNNLKSVPASDSGLGFPLRRGSQTTNDLTSYEHTPEPKVKVKRTNCFLLNTNKSTGFYNVLFIKLSENLCLISLKSNNLSKYCEIITDFDAVSVDFLNLLNKRRTRDTFETSTQSDTNAKSTSTTTPNNKQHKEDQFDKTFLGFFINKLLFFNNKLSNFKNEMNNKDLKSPSTIRASSFLFRTLNVKAINQNKYKERTEEKQHRNNIIRLIQTLQLKIFQFKNSDQLKLFTSFVDNVESSKPPESNCYSYLETQIKSVQSNLRELFYLLFLKNSTTTNDEVSIGQQNKNESPLFAKKASLESVGILYKSTYLIEGLKGLYKKHLFDYIPYLDIKLTRNVAMSFYWHLLPGLIHFSMINRQDNQCIIPSIDASLKYNVDEEKIIQAYRKYLPLVLRLLIKFECTRFQFIDDKLNIVFSYMIWFEDKKSNKIPVDISNEFNENYNNSLLYNNKTSRQIIETKNYLISKCYPPGITEKNFYELIKTLCYPNAPSDNLMCFELITIHSAQLSDEFIKKQFNFMVANLFNLCKNNS
jgi:hypothetical protein